MNGRSHLGCPRCRISLSIRLSVREWAVCGLCEYGGLWSEFMICDCSGYDCLFDDEDA
ncbi:hypothetical protein [Streptomyces catenulae]|uniref:Uncharacterized protein n=1 Tax=Streptomyces catenulae TaxID=66875 RepID=A0ABV2YTC4_9ACTN|nr:hypothetical protein [Streptomyces catenulae]